METSTGRVASVTQVVQVTGRVAGLTHDTVTLAVVCGLPPPVCSAAAAGLLAFQPTHNAVSGLATTQATAAHGTPDTDAAASCGTPPVHRDTPDSVMLITEVVAPSAGGSSGSSVLSPSAGAGNSSNGSTPLTLNIPPASCTTAATLVASVAGVAHDSVVGDSQLGSVHGTPPTHTARLSILACAGGCRPTAAQSAGASRGAGKRSTTRPVPGAC